MARSRETKIELTAYDDLFQTDESRGEAKLSKIRDIPISEIDEFPDHPFKVLMDEDMEQLVESIKRNGVMTPATVRLKEDGRYELISGHRRKKACELAGLETLKCEVKELTRDEAIIVMVESNLQRSVILPSEKAFAYTDNGETQIETPEEGAVFEVFLKSAGSYENAKETERDVLTCDENGFAQTKDMPYGIYTVRQTSGWEGRELMKGFDVFISKDGQTYRYLINNANFESYIKIVKKDAETGNTIPYTPF